MKCAIRGVFLCNVMFGEYWRILFCWLVENSPSLDKLTIQTFHTGHSLRRFGYRLGHASVPLRPRLVSGTESYQLLAGFTTSQGKRRKLAGTFTVSSFYSGEQDSE